MTLLAPLFARSEAKVTSLTLRDDIITSDRILGDLGTGWSGWGSIALDADYAQTYEQIAQKQLWVRIALNKLAYTIGHLPLKVYQRAESGERDRERSGPLLALLRRPNLTKETGNATGFKARLAYDLFTYSNALVVKVQTRPDAPVEQLRPYSPVGWRVEDDTYICRDPMTGIEALRVPSWRMIHIVEPGPTRSGFGVSRLEAARLTLAIEYMAQKLGESTFRNGARPGGIINVKGLSGSPEQRSAATERFKAEIIRRFGGTSKAGLPAVLEGDVSWMAMSHNLDDSAVVQHRQLTREEVAALYDIPQPAIGILDEANFASIDALHLMFYQDTMGWPIALIEDALQQQLIDGVTAYAGQFVEFDMNAVLRGNPDQRSQTYQRLISVGVMTQNEARDFENWKRSTQPEADQLHTPVFLAPNPSLQEADNPGGVPR